MALFSNILLHADSRDEGSSLIDCAVQLMRGHPAKLKLVDIVPQVPWPARFVSGSSDRFLTQLRDSKQDRLHRLASEYERDDLQVSYRVLNAPTSVAIIREAVQGQHDLVMKSAKGRLSRRAGFFGTTAQRLLRKCPTPVLLVKPEFKGPFRHVVAAVDATSEHEQDIQLNEKIMQIARALCPGQEKLSVLHAWSLFGESVLKEHLRPEELEETRQAMVRHAEHCLDDLLIKFDMGTGSECVHLVQGDPIDIIPSFTAEREADLLVMGTVARAGLAGLVMGNSAEQILERVACSVLALKPPDFQTTVRISD